MQLSLTDFLRKSRQFRFFKKYKVYKIPFLNLYYKKIIQQLKINNYHYDEDFQNAGIISFTIPATNNIMLLNPCYWGQRLTLIYNKYYEFETEFFILKNLNPNDYFIDIGANLGYYTLLAAYKIKNKGICYSFDPNPVAFDILKAHVTLNRIKNVKLFNCALHDENTQIKMTWANTESGGGNIRNQTKKYDKTNVKATKGDTILCDISPDVVGIVKIDTEGSEMKVLNGMKKFVETHLNFKYIIEVTPDWLVDLGSSIDEMFKFFNQFNFKPYNINSKGECTISNNFLKLKEQTNIVFIHDKK